MFPGYKSTMLSCGYEIKKDVVLGEKLGAILSVSYIRQKSFKGKYHIILLLDKELNLNPAIVTFLFGVFLCLSRLFVDRSLYSSKIHFFSLEPPVSNVLRISSGGDLTP
jgi:hypothetical protein